MNEVVGAAALTFLGVFEGYAFYACGMYAPKALHDQMQFKRFIVMKVFFSAVGSSMLAQSILSKVSPATFEGSRSYKNLTVGLRRSVLGCAILGSGMAIAGSGPTLIPMQIVGVQNGFMFLAGSVLGGVAYSLVEPLYFPPPEKPKENITLDGMYKKSYAEVAVPFGGALLLATAALEYIFPQSSDASGLGVGPTPWLLPIIAGCVVGANQIPIRYYAKHGQGGSTTIMRFVSILSFGKLSPRTNVTSLASMYQFFYVYAGGILGAFLAMSQAGPTAKLAQPFSATRTLLGAAVMLFGARVANGCTCGHGISGFSELSLYSIAAAMAIFGGGIATALLI
eukprot:PhF_6_TR23819/c0_g1_i1/m.33363